MLTAGGTYYQLVEGYPKHSIKRDEWTAQEKYLMYWSSLFPFVLESFNVPAGIGSVQIIGMFPRTMPGAPFLYTESLDIEPFPPDKPGGTNVGNGRTYSTYCMVTVGYKSMLNTTPMENGVFFTEKITFGGDFLTMPGLSVTFTNPPAQPVPCGEDVTAGMLSPTIEHNLTWEHVPNPPMDAIRSCLGCVNAAAWGGAAPETVLFLGGEMSREVAADGKTKPWKVDYKLSERPYGVNGSMGWNYFWNPHASGTTGSTPPGFQRLRIMGSGAPIYQLADLTTLFQIEDYGGDDSTLR